MGAEALWRGAKRVVGIERLGKACRVIEENWRSFAQPRQIIQVIQGDVVQVLTQLEGCQFDRIYFDPPYESDCYGSVLREIVQGQLLHPSGSLAVEHDPKRPMAEVLGLRLDRQKVYGNSALSLYCRNVSNFSEG
jgi:16S rRNA (guanine(966)-N(2))-methyltransferase RsmD